jgi:hypothetical protein
MQRIQTDHAGDNRLRFVYSDAVISFSVPADVTFGEIAETFDELSIEHVSNPVAIDVTVIPELAIR